MMVDFVMFQNWARKLSILLLTYDVTYRIFVDYNTACWDRQYILLTADFKISFVFGFQQL